MMFADRRALARGLRTSARCASEQPADDGDIAERIQEKAPALAEAPLPAAPATAGPTTRAPLNIDELSAIAFIRSPRPTISAMNAWRAGMSNALTIPTSAADREHVPHLHASRERHGRKRQRQQHGERSASPAGSDDARAHPRRRRRMARAGRRGSARRTRPGPAIQPSPSAGTRAMTGPPTASTCPSARRAVPRKTAGNCDGGGRGTGAGPGTMRERDRARLLGGVTIYRDIEVVHVLAGTQ